MQVFFNRLLGWYWLQRYYLHLDSFQFRIFQQLGDVRDQDVRIRTMSHYEFVDLFDISQVFCFCIEKYKYYEYKYS